MFASRHARHAAKGDLHGITVVVDTTGAELYIGRFFEQRGDGIVLLDVARHSDGANGVSKEQYVQTAARFGQWKEFEQVQLPEVAAPLPEVRSVTRLADAPAPWPQRFHMWLENPCSPIATVFAGVPNTSPTDPIRRRHGHAA